MLLKNGISFTLRKTGPATTGAARLFLPTLAKETICNVFNIHKKMQQYYIAMCRVTGPQRYSSHFPQGELELPCVLTVTTASAKECSKAKYVGI